MLWWGLVGSFLGCTGGPDPALVDPRPAVRSIVTEEKVFADAFTLSATIEAAQTAMLFPSAQGRIATVLVRIGDEVEARQPLLRLDAGAYRAGVAQAESALRVAEAQKAQADATYARYQGLGERNAVTQAELEGVARQAELAAAQVAQAEAALAGARQRLADTVVRAPFAGVIIDRNVDPGDIVGAATRGPPLAIADLSTFRVITAVNERTAPQLKPGQSLTVQADALPGERFSATVERVNAAVDPVSGTVAVEASLPADPRLRHGMSARAILEGVGERFPAVPREALLDRDDGVGRLVLLDGETVRFAEVRYGPSQTDEVPITQGLEVGQRVLVAGHRRLVEGDQVREVQ